jgi:hypothetical protein
MKLATLLTLALQLGACEPPTRENFVKYPTLRQKWSMKCDAPSALAEVNIKGCDNLRQWQIANQQPVLDSLMNRNLGK